MQFNTLVWYPVPCDKSSCNLCFLSFGQFVSVEIYFWLLVLRDIKKINNPQSKHADPMASEVERRPW